MMKIALSYKSEFLYTIQPKYDHIRLDAAIAQHRGDLFEEDSRNQTTNPSENALLGESRIQSKTWKYSKKNS